MISDNYNASPVLLCGNKTHRYGEFYFLYYQDLDRPNTVASTIENMIVVLIHFISMVANFATIVCILRCPERKTVTSCFVVNMAVADIVLVSSIPVVVYMRAAVNWSLGGVPCGLVPYSQLVSSSVLLWTLALISIERHSCIMHPPYRSSLTPKRAFIASTCMWLLALIFYFPVAFWSKSSKKTVSTGSATICSFVRPNSATCFYWLASTVPIFVFIAAVPIGIHLCNYCKILKRIISTRNAWASSCVAVSISDSGNRPEGRRQSEVSISEILTPWARRFSFGNQPPTARRGSMSNQEECRFHKHVKTVRILSLSVVLLLVMWIPVLALLAFMFVSRFGCHKEDFSYFFATLVVAFLNTIANPIFHGFLADNFRLNLQNLCGCSKQMPNNRRRIQCEKRCKQNIIELDNENSNVTDK